jgi:hypothetical protein
MIDKFGMFVGFMKKRLARNLLVDRGDVPSFAKMAAD